MLGRQHTARVFCRVALPFASSALYFLIRAAIQISMLLLHCFCDPDLDRRREGIIQKCLTPTIQYIQLSAEEYSTAPRGDGGDASPMLVAFVSYSCYRIHSRPIICMAGGLAGLAGKGAHSGSGSNLRSLRSQ